MAWFTEKRHEFIADLTPQERDNLIGTKLTDIDAWNWLDYYPISHDGLTVAGIMDVNDPDIARYRIVNDEYLVLMNPQ